MSLVYIYLILICVVNLESYIIEASAYMLSSLK